MFGLEDPYSIIVNVGIVVGCTLLAGLMSGLNLAFFSLDLTTVSTLAMGTNEVQAKRAKRILIVLQHPHWLLVTMLLLNAVAAESLPLALDDLVGTAVAIPVSVIILLIFGEIIPQSVFVSNALAVCSALTYITYAFMILTAPVSLVVALLLDVLIGHREAVFYRRRELREFLSLQVQGADAPIGGEGNDWSDSEEDADNSGKLAPRELKLMMGALSLSETAIKSVVRTHIDDAICVDFEAKVTKELVERVFLCGKSRIPVYNGSRDNCTHYFLSKTLILQTFKAEEDAPLVKDLSLIPAEYIDEDRLMGEAYQLLTANPVHLLFVCESGSLKVTGILTTSDVFESIHSVRFTDESDLENRLPMQMLIKSCWTDKNREKRASVRLSRGPTPRILMGSSRGVHNTSNLGSIRPMQKSQSTHDLNSSLPVSGKSTKNQGRSSTSVTVRPDTKLVNGEVKEAYGTNL